MEVERESGASEIVERIGVRIGIGIGWEGLEGLVVEDTKT